MFNVLVHSDDMAFRPIGVNAGGFAVAQFVEPLKVGDPPSARQIVATGHLGPGPDRRRRRHSPQTGLDALDIVNHRAWGTFIRRFPDIKLSIMRILYPVV